MQQRTVISNGKRFIVNCADYDEGVGAGFAVGQLTLKSYTDLYWYVLNASGSVGSVVMKVNTGSLTSFGTSSYYDLNFPYQLLGSNDGNVYQIYLVGSGSGATLTVSQSMYQSGSFITSSTGAVIDIGKPYLFLQNETDGNYYRAYLSSSGGTTSLVVNQTIISQSWIHPIY